MRVKDGRLIFGIAALDADGGLRYGPVESSGALEGAGQVVREAMWELLGLVPAVRTVPDRLRVDPPSSLAELEEAGRWALLRARGESSLARTRGQALRDGNPGWDRVATTVDAEQAGGAVIRRWEEIWRRNLILVAPGDEESLVDRLDRFASGLPVGRATGATARRGAVGILGEEGRLRIEGSFP